MSPPAARVVGGGPRASRPVAVVVTAALALVVSGCGSDVYYRGELGGAERVPATARSTAAALLDHLDEDDVRAVGGIEDPDATDDPRPLLIATAALDDAEISVSVAPEDIDLTGAELCGSLARWCSDAVATDDAGEATAYQVVWQPAADAPGSGTAGMVLLRGDSRVSVTVAAGPVPTAVDWTRFPVSRTVLESILLDPAIALETTPELVEDGEQIADFVERAFDL